MNHKNARCLLGIFVIIILLIITIGEKTTLDNLKQEFNIDSQKKVVSYIKKSFQNLEEIKFEQSGGINSRTGVYHVSAKVKIVDKWYELSVADNNSMSYGTELSALDKGIGTQIKVLVVFSNGEIEKV